MAARAAEVATDADVARLMAALAENQRAIASGEDLSAKRYRVSSNDRKDYRKRYSRGGDCCHSAVAGSVSHRHGARERRQPTEPRRARNHRPCN
jgi:hypothetical protein